MSNRGSERGIALDESPVGLLGAILITAYLLGLSIALLYGIMRFWPSTSSPETRLVLWGHEVTSEVRLLLVVALSGGLGGMVHALRSLYVYIGSRKLVRSWLPMYLLLPFVGTTLALVFYLVIRGGFFSPQAEVQDISPFGFTALAGLVGMFSEQAVEKLKQVASQLLAPAPKGVDHYEEGGTSPSKGGAGS